ncbi:septum formation protein Maf [Candidatus Endobugula sertula]|uniref:7-methyl-GTP pyrophosphatase n=1 Tax=Candidatus Endobugula sertula TaxID=62101 RepID=A0A1D2QU45_9GAMM|nr:septum formation protein Maf [Candidatus Endobugula sertula]
MTLSLVLASSSPYRREILAKLGIDFTHLSPNIDETPFNGETAEPLVKRLALTKAQKAAQQHPAALIIGSDQVAVLNNNIITKPHNHANAVKQLQQISNQKVTFLTSVCLLNSHTGQHQLCVSPYIVQFLDLSLLQIENYLLKEQPYNCAGSFKSEGLGITLFKSLEGKDPNSLIGLPLIDLIAMLRREGLEPLS